MMASMRIPLAALCAGTMVALAPAQRWRRIQADPSPPPTSTAMAFDFDRQRLLLISREPPTALFGGLPNVLTWERHDDRWLLRDDVATPTTVGGTFTMVYDRIGQRTVLCDSFGSTLVFDGSVWMQLTTFWPSPSDPSLAYDGARNAVVMHDGGLFYELVNDSWITPGSQTPLTINGQRLWSARIAYHEPSQRTVLFGGRNTLAQVSDATYLWDGQAVTQATPATVPPARSRHTTAADPSTGRVVLFGGRGLGGASAFDDVFEWNGSDWSPATAAPRARIDHSAAFDSDTLLVYGGSDGIAVDGFLELDRRQAGNWTSTKAEHAGPLAAHDAARLRTVAVDATTTREFDGYRWIDTGVAPPGTVTALGWHGGTSRLIAIVDDGSTWHWDGTTWSMIVGPGSVPANDNAATSYDPLRDRLVVFGGSDNFSITNETWEWDGVAWTQAQPTLVPAGSSLPALCFNGTTGRCFLFTGQTQEAFEWDGSNWILVNNQTPFVIAPKLGYDPLLGVVLLGQLGPLASVDTSFVFDGVSWNPGPPGPARFAFEGPVVFDLNRGVLISHDPSYSRDVLLDTVDATNSIYGTGCSGALGTPSLRALARVGPGDLLALDAVASTPTAPVLLLAANAQLGAPLPGGCLALVDQPVVAAAAASVNGLAGFAFELPESANLVAVRLFFQTVCLDPAGSLLGLVSLSNGVQVTLGN